MPNIGNCFVIDDIIKIYIINAYIASYAFSDCL